MAALALLMMILLFTIPLVNSNSIQSSTIADNYRQAGARTMERAVLTSALQAAVVSLESDGGAGLMQQDFPEVGLRVYIFSEPETITGITHSVIRLRAVARPLVDQPGVRPNYGSNNTLVATLAYDPTPESRIATDIRFSDTQRQE